MHVSASRSDGLMLSGLLCVWEPCAYYRVLDTVHVLGSTLNKRDHGLPYDNGDAT